MELRDLCNKQWNKFEKQRFLNDDTKAATETFDPESFKHDGFDDRETYVQAYVPALADETRLEQELNDFTPPRLNDLNSSPYQALAIRYGILNTLIRQPDYQMEKSALLESVQSWQRQLIETFEEEEFAGDNLLHLAKAAMDYRNDIDDSELHLIYSYFGIRNEGCEWKHEYYTWLDFFKRLASIDRFPKVSRSEKPAHALDTIEKGLWSLQEQALVYEVSHAGTRHLVGLPEDYAEFVRDWLHYEMSDGNYLAMLEALEPFDQQSTLIEARELFGIETKTRGRNQKRRESIVDADVYPSELLAEVVEKEELKDVVDEYNLDAHKQKTGEMIEAIIEYFEQSRSRVDDEAPTAELYLDCYEDIADGNVDKVPPQLHGEVSEEDKSKKLDILFEHGTAEIFERIFHLEGTNLLGQQSSGSVADGEIEQDGQWLLWDNKRRSGEFKLTASTRATIKKYIDTKGQQHDVEWFLIIAPEFADSAEEHALQLEIQTGVDIRLIRAADFTQLVSVWRGNFETEDRELPLAVFTGSDELNLDVVESTLDAQFS